jgi:hypothetical protein
MDSDCIVNISGQMEQEAQLTGILAYKSKYVKICSYSLKWICFFEYRSYDFQNKPSLFKKCILPISIQSLKDQDFPQYLYQYKPVTD